MTSPLTASERSDPILALVNELTAAGKQRGLDTVMVEISAKNYSFERAGSAKWHGQIFHKLAWDGSCACGDNKNVVKNFEGATPNEIGDAIRAYVKGLEIWTQDDVAATLGLVAP